MLILLLRWRQTGLDIILKQVSDMACPIGGIFGCALQLFYFHFKFLIDGWIDLYMNMYHSQEAIIVKEY